MASIDSTHYSKTQIDNIQPVSQTITNIVNSNTSIVTLTDTQTLTNKDLTSATNTFPTSLATLTGTQTLTNKIIQVQDGSNTNPSCSFVNQQDMGFFKSALNTIGITTAGVSRITISDVSMSSNIPINCDNFRAINFGFPGNTIYGNSNSTAGMYFDVNRINFSTNSVARLGITDTQILPSVAIRNIDGTTSSPAYSFSSATGNGMWMNTSNRLAFSISGSTIIQVASSGLDVLGNIGLNSGTSTAPSLVCRTAGISTTGLYWTATPTLNVAISGTQAVGFETGGLRLYGSTAGNNSLYQASLLQYYEDRTESMQFSFSPGGQTTAAGNVRFIRIGNKVTMQLPSYGVITNNSGASRAYISTTTIPLRFQPTYLIMQPITAVLNGANTNTLNLYISSGTIYIERVDQLFANTNTLATYGMTVTWII